MIKNIKVGYLSTNCYVVSNGDECVILDPGGEAKKIISYISDNNLKPEAILLTHGHFDHIFAVPDICGAYPGIKIYAHKNEEVLLADPEVNESRRFGLGREICLTDVNYLEDNAELSVCGIVFRLIHTPGHTIGSCSYYIEKENVLFSGDTLFQGCYGRTDFATGSEKDIKNSLVNVLFLLPDETKVYPGHEDFTSIGVEKISNMVRYL